MIGTKLFLIIDVAMAAPVPTTMSVEPTDKVLLLLMAVLNRILCISSGAIHLHVVSMLEKIGTE